MWHNVIANMVYIALLGTILAFVYTIRSPNKQIDIEISYDMYHQIMDWGEEYPQIFDDPYVFEIYKDGRVNVSEHKYIQELYLDLRETNK